MSSYSIRSRGKIKNEIKKYHPELLVRCITTLEVSRELENIELLEKEDFLGWFYFECIKELYVRIVKLELTDNQIEILKDTFDWLDKFSYKDEGSYEWALDKLLRLGLLN